MISSFSLVGQLPGLGGLSLGSAYQQFVEPVLRHAALHFEQVKSFFVLMLVLAATIVWQTSVLSKEKQIPAVAKAIEQLQQENRQAGRVSFDDQDCD